MTRDWTQTGLGDRVIFLIEREGLTMNKLCKRAGLGSGVVSRLSKDRGQTNRSPGTLDKLAKSCGVSVEWLTYGRGQPEEASGALPDEPRPDQGDPRDWTGSTLGDRVRHLAKERRVSISRLGERAGLNRTAIWRMAKDTSSEVKRFAGTIDKLAKTWNTSTEWLVYGRGEMGAGVDPEEPADPFPHRAEACDIARDGGTIEGAVREIEELSDAEVRVILGHQWERISDPPVLWWLHQIEARAVLRRVGGR